MERGPRFKPGVVVVEVLPTMRWAWAVCERVSQEVIGRYAYITCVHEGDHRHDSKHYYDPQWLMKPNGELEFAFDLRARDLVDHDAEPELRYVRAYAYRNALAHDLGPNFDVVVETYVGDDGRPTAHVHIERDMTSRPPTA